MRTASIAILLALPAAWGCGVSPAPEALVPPGFTSPLPIVAIESAGPIGDEPKIRARMQIDPGFDSWIGIERRGRSSQIHFPKKQFAFELRTEGNIQKEETMLGMPAESDWVLLGPYSDKSLLRDALTFELSRSMGRWAPRGVFVELFLREGAPRPAPEEYQGLYLLTERISRGTARVDLPPSRRRTGEDSGFLLKIDWLDPSVREAYFSTGSGEWVIVVYPAAKDLTEPQLAYLKGWFSRLEGALSGESDSEELIDLDSFVDIMILQELAKNVDAYRSSTYFYKPPSGKLFLGPLWDMNQAYGNAAYDADAMRAEGWRFQKARPDSWFTLLFDDPRFRARFAERYRALRKGPLSQESLEAWLDAAVSKLTEPARRNFERWPILATVVFGNPDEPPGSWEGEIARLKSWLAARTLWMDRELL
jgi:hypothetical protein